MWLLLPVYVHSQGAKQILVTDPTFLLLVDPLSPFPLLGHSNSNLRYSVIPHTSCWWLSLLSPPLSSLSFICGLIGFVSFLIFFLIVCSSLK